MDPDTMSNFMADSIARLSKARLSRFFSSNAPATQKLCDQEAERLLGMPVQPTPVQGGYSYTVVSEDDTYVVQFRCSESALDMSFIQCIEQAYEGFTPHHEFIAKLGELYVYKMGNVGGISMYLARGELYKDNCRLLRRTVSDFARFFASAWHKTPSSMQCPDRATLYNQYLSDLTTLQQGLPERFRPTLNHLIAKLPSLFNNDWPLVPNHTNLRENNIHVSTETGGLTGICDWRDVTVSPFGVSLGGLEGMLGFASLRETWVYHANQQELRDLFWETLYEAMGDVSAEQKELMDVARLIGLFMANGLGWADEHTRVPVSEGHHTLCYLEAVTLKLWAQTVKSKAGNHSENPITQRA